VSGPWVYLVSVLLLFGNAFFVGAEFAAMAVRRSTLEPLADAGSRRAQSCLLALERLGSMLATAQLGITVCSVGLGALAEAALHHLFEPVFAAWSLPDAWASGVALALALLIVSYLHVVVGEMIPKNLAIAGPDRAALLLVPPLFFLARALRPIVHAMEALAKSLVRLFRVEPKDELTSAFTVEEVAHIVGDIADEHDRLGDQAQRRRDGSWLLSGLLRPDEVEDLTAVALPESEDYDTVAGLVLQVLGRVPATGDIAEVAVPEAHPDDDAPRERMVTLTVDHMDGLRIDRLTLRLLEPGSRAGSEGEEP